MLGLFSWRLLEETHSSENRRNLFSESLRSFLQQLDVEELLGSILQLADPEPLGARDATVVGGVIVVEAQTVRSKDSLPEVSLRKFNRDHLQH